MNGPQAHPGASVVPATMRAAVLVGTGGPEMLEVRADEPVPSAAGDEVLIEVAACGVNNTDINTRVGWYSRSVTGSWSIPGSATPSVPTTASWPATWAASVPTCDGGFAAEYCAVPARNVPPIETALSDVELAGFACSWSTAEHMLQRVELREGQSIAVTGASGGVGTALVQLAKRRIARVVAIAGRSKLAGVAGLGADVVVARDHDDVPAAATEANGGPFDVVADVVGGADFGIWLDSLRRGGRYVTSGAIAGPMVQLDLRTLYLNDLELYGATVFEPRVFADLVGYIERGEVRPVVAASYPLQQIHEAQAAFEQKNHIGSLVITIR